MEQIYLIEMFIDKVSIILSEQDAQSSANKNLTIKARFGPKIQFIIKEGEMVKNEGKTDDTVVCDNQGKKRFSRTIRIGRSMLFPSYPDTIVIMLAKFPLEIELWNDDDKEEPIFIGVGSMKWDTSFFAMLKETSDPSKMHEPLAVKQLVTMWNECCCSIVGEVCVFVRISSLGDSIITEYQQLKTDPNTFVFRANKAPSMFQCKRREGDELDFCMIGSLYESTTLEDPDILANAQNKIEICTELESCGMGQTDADYLCEHRGDEEKTEKKTYPISMIRMGDITGPCGNANCALAKKVKKYIRTLDSYKKEAGNLPTSDKEKSKKVCGKCGCNDDRYHRDSCPQKVEQPPKKEECGSCGNPVPGNSCEDKTYGKQINYMFSTTKMPSLKQSAYGRSFIEENLGLQFSSNSSFTDTSCCSNNLARTKTEHTACNTNLPTSDVSTECTRNKVSKRHFGTQQIVYNVTSKGQRGLPLKPVSVYNTNMTESLKAITVYNCTEAAMTSRDDKDCKCSPPKPTPPCKTFDCECLTEVQNIAARKQHKPFCPLYKHKATCPVTMIDEELAELNEFEDAEAEPLPYGLPPVQLGPCPVIGRPCTYPDGFARMYKTAAMPNLPPSYSEAGKVCCSKEFERIKKALKEYLKNQKENDFRCINKFNVDTERRCCDKEQQLLSLMGKACCGSHKMAIQEKFKEDK